MKLSITKETAEQGIAIVNGYTTRPATVGGTAANVAAEPKGWTSISFIARN